MSKKNEVKLSEVALKSPTPKPSLSFFSKWNVFLIPLVISIITFVVFAPVLQNNFVNVDDNGYVLLNKYLAKPFSESIPYFFGLHFFVGNYHPLTMIVYAIIYHVAGYNPAAYHAVNLAIHVLNVLLVFWFIFLLSGK